MRPIRASVLLLVPDEFERFVYLGTHGEPLYPFGETAVQELNLLLHSAFASAASMPVRSEAEAMRMLSPEDPDTRSYDWIAIPRFAKVDSWARNQEYGYDVDIDLELYTPGRTKVEKIRGHGESKTGGYSGFTPRESARLALTYAVDALKDGLEMRRSSLFMAR